MPGPVNSYGIDMHVSCLQEVQAAESTQDEL